MTPQIRVPTQKVPTRKSHRESYDTAGEVSPHHSKGGGGVDEERGPLRSPLGWGAGPARQVNYTPMGDSREAPPLPGERSEAPSVGARFIAPTGCAELGRATPPTYHTEASKRHKKLPRKMRDSCSIFLVSNKGTISRLPVSSSPLNVVPSYYCCTNRRSDTCLSRKDTELPADVFAPGSPLN